MPWLFLFVGVAAALLTLNVHAGPRRASLVHGLGFFPGWLTGELAGHHLAWHAVAVAFFVYAGALRAWPGWVALGLLAASAVGLVLAFRKARGAADVLEASLVETLGHDYRDALSPEVCTQIAEGMSWRQRIAPIPPFVDGRVERTRNVPYVTRPARRQHLDVYRPAGHPTNCPVLLFIHGGAWVVGSKEEQGLPLIQRLAAHGWVCVSANYRLSPRATFPAAIIDVKSALRWVREHIAEYGGDPNFIVISGGSAGGHLASLAALTPGDPAWQPGFEGADTSVAACVPFYGVYDFTDRHGHWRKSKLLAILERAVFKKKRSAAPDEFDRASPMSRVTPDAPPFFVLHGTHDTLVPVEDARYFVRALREHTKAPVAYAELPGAEHAFEIFPSERALHALRAVESFLWCIYERYRAKAPAQPSERSPR